MIHSQQSSVWYIYIRRRCTVLRIRTYSCVEYSVARGGRARALETVSSVVGLGAGYDGDALSCILSRKPILAGEDSVGSIC